MENPPLTGSQTFLEYLAVLLHAASNFLFRGDVLRTGGTVIDANVFIPVAVIALIIHLLSLLHRIKTEINVVGHNRLFADWASNPFIDNAVGTVAADTSITAVESSIWWIGEADVALVHRFAACSSVLGTFIQLL